MGEPPTIEVPLVDLAAQRRRVGADVEVAMAAVLEHGQFIQGPEVGRLEDELARRCGAGHAVGCSSGTDALLLALLAWGVGPGQAVFVPTFTFVATAEVVALLGATPVFVDIEAATFNLHPASLAAAVGSARDLGLRPAGVIAVDLFGHPADYGAIKAVAADEGMWVLADAAQSLGATLGGRPVGSLADATATSFFPAKPLGCYGDGGAVFTDDAGLAERVRSLQVHGKGQDKYDNVRIGINGRLDTLQAAVLLAKLPYFDDELVRRQQVAARYADGLAGVVGTPTVAPGASSAWANYTVTAPRRDRLAVELRQAGIASAVYYARPLHRQRAYRRFPVAPGGLAVAERMAEEVLSLPMHPYLGPVDQDRVIDAVRAALSLSR